MAIAALGHRRPAVRGWFLDGLLVDLAIRKLTFDD
jgi:hypothetical protein